MNRLLILLVALFFQVFHANASFYVDGFGYASKYKDGVIRNIITGKEELERHAGGGSGVSVGIASKFEDVFYLGLEIAAFSIGNPTTLDFINFKVGFSLDEFSAYLLGGFSFSGIAQGGGIEYVIKKGGKETSSKSRAIALFSEYKRYNHLFDDSTHILKLGIRLYM